MKQPEYDRARIGAYLGLGAGFGLSTLFFAWLGYLLDGHIGSTPAFTLAGAFLGGAAGFYNLYRHAMELQKSDRAKKDEDDEGSEPNRKTSTDLT